MRKILLILAVFFTVYGNLFAQNDSLTIISKKCLLNSHYFVNTFTSKSAFINTYLNSEIGIGNTGHLNLPGIKLGDTEIFPFTGSVTFATVNLNYRQKFNDWLALRISLTMGGRIGDNISTILVDGLNTFSGGSIGWDFSVLRNERFQMSGSVFVKNIAGSFVDIAGYVNDIINKNPYAEVVKNIPVLNAGVGLQAAFAVNETYGLQFGTDVSYGEAFERNKQSVYSSFNISGDMDLNPNKNIPLGFAFGYMISSNPEDTYLEFIYTNILIGKIAYTGSTDFDLGWQIQVNNVKLSEAVGGKHVMIKSQIDFKLYF